MDSQLKVICQEILDNENDTGCNGDMTVTSLKAIKKLRKYMNKIHRAEMEYKRKKELVDLRNMAAQKCFEEHNLDGLLCIDHEGWEQDGVIWLKKFYYEDEKAPLSDSRPATFIVIFKENSDTIKESYVNSW